MHMNIRINIVKIDKMVYNIYRGVRQFGAKYITGGNPVW